jgi:hypothetical protein
MSTSGSCEAALSGWNADSSLRASGDHEPYPLRGFGDSCDSLRVDWPFSELAVNLLRAESISVRNSESAPQYADQHNSIPRLLGVFRAGICFTPLFQDHVISIEHESPFSSARIGVARGVQALEQVLLDRAQIL